MGARVKLKESAWFEKQHEVTLGFFVRFDVFGKTIE